MLQFEFFDLNDRFKKLDERNPLVSFNRLIDWDNFRSTLNIVRNKVLKSNEGRKFFDVVLMFKMLILQHLYNVSDNQIEYQIRGRYFFCRFLDLTPSARAPDAKMIWLFREPLTHLKLIRIFFYDFGYRLNEQYYQVRKGQNVDARFADALKQLNNKEENKQISSPP